jgi:hypothetical protein
MHVLANDEVCLLFNFGQGPSAREFQNLGPDLVTDCPKPWLLLVLSRLVWELILTLGALPYSWYAFLGYVYKGPTSSQWLDSELREPLFEQLA